MKQDIASNIAFIMVRPEFLGNIGSVARIMKNFGFSDLRLVNPPKNYRDAEARMMAVGAFDILKNAKIYGDLESALEGTNLTVSTSSGRRRARELDNLADAVGEIVSLASANRIAFVFGNERNGLTDDEVSLCNKKIRIESSSAFPSLNLAQAAAIVAYSLSAQAQAHKEQPSQTEPVKELAGRVQQVEMLQQLDLLLGSSEFSRDYNKRLILSQLKDAIDRMAPTKREVALFTGVLFRLNHKLELIPRKTKRNKTGS